MIVCRRIKVCSGHLSLPLQMTKILVLSFTNLRMVWDFGILLPEREMLFLTSDVYTHEV